MEMGDITTYMIMGIIGYPILKRNIEEWRRGKNIIAKIPFHGTIDSGNPGKPKMTSPQGLEKVLGAIKKDKRIKAVIFDINSGGGEASASKEIYEMVKAIEVPKVAYVSGICASGSYMTACGCDEIISPEDTIIGSIGVIMQKPVAEELMKKIGVKFETIKSGENKDFFGYHRSFSDEERKLLEDMIKDSHERFVSLVYDSRKGKMDEEVLQKFATGKITDGPGALKLGLIDRVGNFKKAIEVCEMRGNFKHTNVKEYMYKQSFFGNTLATAGYHFGNGIIKRLIEASKGGSSIKYE